jgi:hypothetical protein
MIMMATIIAIIVITVMVPVMMVPAVSVSVAYHATRGYGYYSC